MKIFIKKKPRIFFVGKGKKIKVKDHGKIFLEKNDQISFVTQNGAIHDVAKKDWGFYATQSVNSRLKKNFKTALVINEDKKIYILLVEKKKIYQFKKYCSEEKQKILIWLDEIKYEKKKKKLSYL